jgi:hypothetical protein
MGGLHRRLVRGRLAGLAEVASFPIFRPRGQVAQLVEQRTENPRVGGSIPSLATLGKPARQPWHIMQTATPPGGRFHV